MIAANQRAPAANPAGDQYPAFIAGLRAHFAAQRGPLFRTDAEGLWPVFLLGLPPEMRQHHNCNACRHFVERFGGLVTIDDAGRTRSALWDFDAPPVYAAAVSGCRRVVENARVSGAHLSSQPWWGTPVTGAWTHMAVKSPAVFTHLTLTAGQVAADKAEDRRLLEAGLEAYPVATVRLAHALLTDGRLYRSEKCVGVAKWLLDLHERLEGVKHTDRRNALLWSAVATAPAGFCHVGSTMIGTLLDDLEAGMDIGQVKHRFDSKMSPLQYQRPQAPPTAGNIAEAERIVGALKAAGSLERRFARLEDVQAVWWPRNVSGATIPEGGIFSHLAPKQPKAPAVQHTGGTAVTMTWEKFARDVLPGAEKVEALVPSHGSFIALTTATNPDAPPILQWDREDARNPVAWYVYGAGSPALQWGLVGGSFARVTAAALLPPMWGGGHEHHGAGVVLLLDGCRDSNNNSLSLFPETLRSELRPVRATIEAYSRAGKLGGQEQATACGLDLRKGRTWDITVRVTRAGIKSLYMLDRWD